MAELIEVLLTKDGGRVRIGTKDGTGFLYDGPASADVPDRIDELIRAGGRGG